ncbi:hypothetical protein B0T16DRAFT_460837 [Cercophora newfieldiana]|uniref:Uncharacterized protein n=1 Tax=Cercophora newfieldiana TaxID=92897 RepID=A0AA39XV43_9PEZI|nr:hypothetical protein B0T16DRAFT_460837 [Cercophora newfieldiana]
MDARSKADEGKIGALESKVDTLQASIESGQQQIMSDQEQIMAALCDMARPSVSPGSQDADRFETHGSQWSIYNASPRNHGSKRPAGSPSPSMKSPDPKRAKDVSPTRWADDISGSRRSSISLSSISLTGLFENGYIPTEPARAPSPSDVLLDSIRRRNAEIQARVAAGKAARAANAAAGPSAGCMVDDEAANGPSTGGTFNGEPEA